MGLRIALAFFAGGALIGGPWDMLWHMSQPFESFYSPPHMFIYGMTAASVAVVAVLAAKPALRGAFGPTRKLWPTSAEMPASLVLLGAGLGVVLLSGVIDEFWHASFGVDETRFSTPHSMFGWGLLVATLGFASARLALKKRAPMGGAEAFGLSFLVISFSLYAFLLPFLVYPTAETVRAIAGLPALGGQPGAAHTFRIYEAWGIDRSNPMFLPLAAAWGGALTTMLAMIHRETRPALVAAAAATALYGVLWYSFALRLGTASDPRAWLPLPLLPALLVGAVREWKSLEPGRAEWVAAAVFCSLTVAVWPPNGGGLWPLIAVIAAVFVFKGALLASVLVGAAVVEPQRRWAPAMPLALGICIPVLWGLLDLRMRMTTP